MSLLCVLISNCSRLFLSTWGDLSTQNFDILVGSGMGPLTLAPVLRAVSTISFTEWSRRRWSYALSLILILWLSNFQTPLVNFYSTTLVTTPAPTVLPPSLMANLNPSSMAIGVISSTSILTLSPGITISTPSGSVTTPVTSVVLK